MIITLEKHYNINIIIINVSSTKITGYSSNNDYMYIISLTKAITILWCYDAITENDISNYDYSHVIVKPLKNNEHQFYRVYFGEDVFSVVRIIPVNRTTFRARARNGDTCLLEKSLTQLIDPAEPTVRTFTEKRESAFTLLRPEIPGRKLSPRPRYSCRERGRARAHTSTWICMRIPSCLQRVSGKLYNGGDRSSQVTQIFSQLLKGTYGQANAPHIPRTGIPPSFLRRAIPPRVRKQIIAQCRVKLLLH